MSQTKIFAKFAYPNNGYEADKINASILMKNEYYAVESINMGQSHTSVCLKNLRGSFNSVHFTFHDADKKEIDIFEMPEFNPYLNMNIEETNVTD